MDYSQPLSEKAIKAIREIRQKLGIGLRESRDYYLRCPDNWKERLTKDVITMHASGAGYRSPEERIREVMLEYVNYPKHPIDLDLEARTLASIQAILGIKSPEIPEVPSAAQLVATIRRQTGWSLHRCKVFYFEDPATWETRLTDEVQTPDNQNKI